MTCRSRGEVLVGRKAATVILLAFSNNEMKTLVDELLDSGEDLAEVTSNVKQRAVRANVL
jgi:hypothetical protein